MYISISDKLFNYFLVESRYDEWAGNYESHMSSVGYPGPRNVACAVAELFPEKKNIRILDMAAGIRSMTQFEVDPKLTYVFREPVLEFLTSPIEKI
jgi:hypothetical protein